MHSRSGGGRASLPYLLWLGWGGAMLILLTSCSAPPPSTPAPVLLLRPLPVTASQAGLWSLPKMGSRSLQPPLLFPKGSSLVAIEVRPPNGSNVWLPEYVVASSLSWQATCRFYQQVYAQAKVKWLGTQRSRTGANYVFFVYPSKGSMQNVMTFLIAFPSTSDPETKALGLSTKQQACPLLWITSQQFCEASPQGDPNTGRPMETIYVPVMP